ncbi:neutral zinc metallopeptidase [Planosporangium sp. 12N6]|uniref:KPN_02809 family neutral zinc metallopeptidase n=1 Tax=Planosporangium spinosum TaxID=3402278 RepID=UPI003CFB494C
MELNENADLDTSQVEDARGAGGGGGGFGGLPIPIGGGGMGLIVTIVVVVIGLLVGGGTLGRSMLGGGGSSGQGDNSSLAQRCATSNPDRFKNTDCRNLLYVNSIQAYWQTALPQTFGKQYTQAPTHFFSSNVTTACGQADSGVGPFYCPGDKKVYIDLSFYDELSSRFGAKGEFAQPYVLAHEYGHHVQNLLGTEAQMRRAQQRDPNNANAYSVKLELQADCYAGVWTNHATQTRNAKGQALFTSVTDSDVRQALDAAAAVGDDAIQKKMGGGVDESKFTHGSSADRQRWFNQGYSSGDARACDTFGNG